MNRIIRALGADVKFQFRQGFYLVYLILTIIYIAIIYQLGSKAVVFAVPLAVYADPSMVGFIFTGGLVMLEQQQGITGYVGITPLKTGEFIASKIISLGILALIASLAIAVSSGQQFNAFILASSVVLVSVFHSLIGFIAAAGCRSMNDYFIRMIPYMLLIVLPAIGFLESPWFAFFRIFPGFAGLRIILSAFDNGTTAVYINDYLVLLIWICVLPVYAIRRFDRLTIRK